MDREAGLALMIPFLILILFGLFTLAGIIVAVTEGIHAKETIPLFHTFIWFIIELIVIGYFYYRSEKKLKETYSNKKTS